MGFKNVYLYDAGKQDWILDGLPTEGRQAGALRAVVAARKDLPTCEITDSLDTARQKMEPSGHDFCVVLNPQGVVLGRVRKKDIDEADGGDLERVMQEGPTTIRPGEDLMEVTGRLQDADVDSVLVTTSEGVLAGALYRKDAEEAIHASHAGVRG
jgi:CBS domain-containing protein